MATLRLRISTVPPLAPLKALFLVAASSRTIADLKAQLVHDLGQLRGVASTQLLLEVDGWELLDGSQVELVREGDVISVKLHEGAAPALDESPAADDVARMTEPAALIEQKKRKRSPPAPVPKAAAVVASSVTVEPSPAATGGSAPAGRPPAKKAKHSAKAQVAPPVVTPAVATSSSGTTAAIPDVSPSRLANTLAEPAGRTGSSTASDSSTSESDSSDSSSDDSSSGSSASSSSSSSSSGSSAPSLKSSRRGAPSEVTPKAAASRPGTTIRLTPIIPLQPPVPPGSGSAATRERNLRRRAKKKALRAGGGAVTGSPAPSTATASVAKATPPPTATPSQSADTDMEAVEASISAAPAPAFLPTQRNQVLPTAADVAVARLAQPAEASLAIPFTTSANRNKSKAFKKAAAGGLSGFKTVFDLPSESETPSAVEMLTMASPVVLSRPETPVSTRTSQRSTNGPLYGAVAPPASYTTPTSSSASAKKGKKGRPSAVAQQLGTPRPHLPAPSDRPPTSLPPGMFVTSVDVEDPVWEANVGGGAWAAYLGLEESKIKEQVWEKGAMALDYGADEPAAYAPPTTAAPAAATMPAAEAIPAASSALLSTPSAVSQAPKDEADWDALETAYASSGPLAWEAVYVGSEVIFKELILDPTTYSPSLALHHGTVTAVTATSATVHVRVHYAEEAADEDEDDGAYDDGQARGPGQDDWEERVVSHADWIRSDWRAVVPAANRG